MHTKQAAFLRTARALLDCPNIGHHIENDRLHSDKHGEVLLSLRLGDKYVTYAKLTRDGLYLNMPVIEKHWCAELRERLRWLGVPVKTIYGTPYLPLWYLGERGEDDDFFATTPLAHTLQQEEESNA